MPRKAREHGNPAGLVLRKKKATIPKGACRLVKPTSKKASARGIFYDLGMRAGVLYRDNLAVPILAPHGTTLDATRHVYNVPARGKTRGLLNLLKQHLWPNWKYVPPRGRYRRGQASSSCQEGILVEEQVKAYFLALSRDHEPLKPCRHRLARGFCNWVLANGYTVAASQWPVFDPMTHVCTAFDFILFSAEEERKGKCPWIAVELKTGYNRGHMLAQGTFAHPQFAHIPCTRTNMAYAQLTAMCATAQECYNTRLVPMVVFVRSETHVVATPIVRTAVYKCKDQIRAALCGANMHLPAQQREVIVVE